MLVPDSAGKARLIRRDPDLTGDVDHVRNYHHHKWPYSFSYFAASECNLRCVHCYVEGGHSIPRADEPLSKRRAFIEKLRSIGYEHVIFVGGEPTLSPTLKEDIRFVLAEGLRPVVFTNGVAVGADIVAFAEENPPTSFVVSLYGTERHHDRFTQTEGSYRASMATVERICESSVPLQLNVAVNRVNADAVQALVHG